MYVERDMHAAMQVFRVLDTIMSVMLPTYFNLYNREDENSSQLLWPITENQISDLRMQLAAASASGETFQHADGTEERMTTMFGALPETPVDYVVDPNDASKTVPVTLQNAFKVYVYEVADYSEQLAPLTSGALFCKDGMMGAEVDLHYWFLTCPGCRTTDPDEADFFYVPSYAGCLLEASVMGNSAGESATKLNTMFKELVPKLKYWKRSQGRDHIFTLPGGRGAQGLVPEWKKTIGNSILIVQE